ncbi:M16 family metallopeptidase [Calycomorphotria hydatis]|uniref:Protease 3 n=1 Tax=Calycomorphotria hydatis TaxID=2528027 RepID=A0A517T3L5_9PLAN|nr:pitrilysin family protein [Calycomorphotria hydatis]QDT62965.1 Protease 3 precursor [Calycomorphotria hydatis]
MQFHQQVLGNGLNVVAEVNPNAFSSAVGFFVRTGSRDETDAVSGVSHFLEHMAFKGDDNYSADDVNRIFDELGADYNASTSEEITLYYAAVLPEYLPKTLELLATLIRPSLRQDDFDMEKQVILEEIGMYDDQPSFLVYDKAMSSHFAGHPLGRSILGTVESISALTSAQMREYHATHYVGSNITLALAGAIDWPQVVDLANQFCGHIPAGSIPRPTNEATPPGGLELMRRESSTQQYVMQMAPAPPARSPMRFAAELLSVIVGDDSGSRMYWDLVDSGLCEAAELGFNEFDGSGAWMTFLSGMPETTAQNLDRITAIYQKVNESGVTEEELEQAKNKAASRIVLRSERPMGRLSALGSNWVYRGEYDTVADDLSRIKAVTQDDILELLEAYPIAQTTTVAIGPLESL